ncbi:MAG TPA: hypothetical protein VGI74_03090, partial [Streptosporangiaceae bacterium]
VAASTGHRYGQAMTAGHIYTIAGNGTAGYSGNGGPATAARFSIPGGVTQDGAGNLAIADTGNRRIRVVAARTGRFYGRVMTAGHVYTVAGSAGRWFSGAGGPATATEFSPGPHGPGVAAVALDAAGNLVLTAPSAGAVLVEARSTGTFYGQAMTAGHIYTIAGNGTAGYSGNSGPATKAEFRFPWGVAVDESGNLLIADDQNNRIRLVAEQTGTFYGQAMTAGHIYTIAGSGTPGFTGDGGPATAAALHAPTGVAVDATGNLLVADTGNNRVRVVAASTGHRYGQEMTAGHIYTIAGSGTPGFTGDGGPAIRAGLGSPGAVTPGTAGNLVIADTLDSRIRVVAGTSGTFYGQQMTAGHIYTVAGGGTAGCLGDGGPAMAGELGFPQGVTVDPAGDVLIADWNCNRVLEVPG